MAVPALSTTHSTAGFSVSVILTSSLDKRLPVHIEIDWADTDGLTVDRERLRIPTSLHRTIAHFLLQRIADIFVMFVKQHSESRFLLSNRAIVVHAFPRTYIPIPKTPLGFIANNETNRYVLNLIHYLPYGNK